MLRKAGFTHRKGPRRETALLQGLDDMNGRLSNLLKIVAKWMLFVSAASFAAGFVWLIVAAPCSNMGTYILLSSVVLMGFSACMLFVRACLIRTRDAFGLTATIAFYTAIAFAITYYSALMLCRGV
jgi:hypothetical protein